MKIGNVIPDINVQYMVDGEVKTESTSALCANKNVVFFAVPGAFTPTCSQAHLPGYVTLADQIKAKGIDLIVCISVNDAFVMDAWGKSQNAEHVLMVADGGASFTKAINLEMDTADFGGLRSQRYAMVVRNGVVDILNVEKPKEFEASKAETILALL